MPLKPSPKAADTANRPASLCVTRKAPIASAWHAEPRISVSSPPTRSASQPQNCLLAKAQACSSDSISALDAAGTPTSLQNAMRWLCGSAIGTQQQKPATHKIASTKLAGSPSALPRTGLTPLLDAACEWAGGG